MEHYRTRIFNLIAASLFILLAATIQPGIAADWDLKSDAWVATDALGRQLSDYVKCGDARANRTVGIFYFLWHGYHGGSGIYDNTKILAANPTNPLWGPQYEFHHWGESELGYYVDLDSYVIRRHCEQLVDAGVDVLILDATNAFTYTSEYMNLCNVYSAIRAEGGRTPQICFITNASSAIVITKLYNEFYSQKLYPDLWFRWQGKPLILGVSDGLSMEIQNFFTIRQSWAWHDPNGWFGDGKDKWPWIDNFPQAFGWNTQGVAEESSVCLAQHATTNIGRSFRNGAQPGTDQYGLCATTGDGLCFEEQFSRIYGGPDGASEKIDPEFLYVTGWNEWVAQRFVSDGSAWFLGKKLEAGKSYFVDAYNQEYSRDIEPMKGGHTDNYYYQLMDYVRRFKGVRKPDPASAPKTIAIDASFDDWADVQPEYRDTIGDTAQRASYGWANKVYYSNTTGRNDFKMLKTTYDSDNVYFYAETVGNLKYYTSANWMLLFIDSDCNPATGWHGYDYLINYPPSSSSKTKVKRCDGGWNWTEVGEASYRYLAKKLEIAVPRSMIGQTGRVMFDFHWADNIQKADDITEFFVSGDSAPNRRANYHFVSGPTSPVSQLALTPGKSEIRLDWINPADRDYRYTIVRASESAYPATPDDGTLIAKKVSAYGVADSVQTPTANDDTTLYFTLFTFNSTGIWSSAQISGKPIVGPPDDPSGLNAVADYVGNITISWTNPTDGDFIGTKVRMSMNAFPASPNDGDAVCGKTGAPGAADSCTIGNAQERTTYYFAAFSYDNGGRVSAGAKFALTVPTTTCGLAKTLPQLTPVKLNGKVVTAVFPASGCYYIAEPNMSSGIRVTGSTTNIAVGDVLNIYGTLGLVTINGRGAERHINLKATPTKISSNAQIQPNAMANRSVGGSAVGKLAPGVRGTSGVNNVGMLVKIIGRVTSIRGNDIYIDDGGQVPNVSSAGEEIGVRVNCPSAPSVAVGNFISATGVVAGYIPTGYTENFSNIRIRSLSDTTILN